ncbi:MAG TPA: YlxR family protein [Acidimicrobiales bacterium]|nr:YlxR family protein [Acidimicrobiales bacterium]
MGCRRVAAPTELVRVVRTPDGGLAVGRALPGRGAWLCAGAGGCVDLAERRRAFSRALRGPVEGAAVAALRAQLRERARIEDCDLRS